MTSTEKIRGWLTGRLPDDWFAGEPTVEVDRDEIVIVGALDEPERGEDVTDEEHEAAIKGRIKRFRESTRDQRIRIARELERSSGRKVAWGVEAGGDRRMFTTLAAPVMTRLRQPERRVLDTLVDAGVARSRSDALGWCVRLVGKHQEEWIGSLRDALVAVEEARARGPEVG